MQKIIIKVHLLVLKLYLFVHFAKVEYFTRIFQGSPLVCADFDMRKNSKWRLLSYIPSNVQINFKVSFDKEFPVFPRVNTAGLRLR